MALNLVSLVSQFLTPQLVGSLARAVGVNEAVAQQLVAAAIPLVLGAIGTTAAAPGGAQRVVDAVSNSDPDLLTKLAGALGGGNAGALSQGANLLGGLLGGSGVASLAGALSQFSGAPPAAAQTALGAVSQATVGTIGQQDPSNWSDPQSIAALFTQPEGRDRRRASAGTGEGPRADRASGGPRRPRRGRRPAGDRRRRERGKRRLFGGDKRDRRGQSRPDGRAASGAIRDAGDRFPERLPDLGDRRPGRGGAGGRVVVHVPASHGASNRRRRAS